MRMKQCCSSLLCFFFICFFLCCNLNAQLQWTPLGSLSDPRMLFGAVYLGNGEILVAGGFIVGSQNSGYVCSNSCEIIDVNKKTISPTSAMTYPRVEFPLLLTRDSNIVAVSGAMNDQFSQGRQNRNTPTVEMFNRTTKQWRVLGNLLVARRQHAAVFINDDELLVIGGRLESMASTDTAEIFNIKTGQSRYVANYPVSRCEVLSGITSNERIIACTGREGGANSQREATVFRYDPVVNRWTTNGNLYGGVRVASLLKLWDNRLLMSGGVRSESPYACEKSVWVDSSGVFIDLGQMQNERLGHCTAQLNSDNVIMAGRWNSDWSSANATAEIMSLSTRQSKSIASMRAPRAQFAMVSVPTKFDANGKPISAKVVAISGASGRIVDGSGNSTGYILTPTVDMLEDCTITPPVVTLGATTLCNGETTALALPQCYTAMKWSTGATNNMIVVSEAGDYSVDVIDANGCSGHAQVTIRKIQNAYVVDSIMHDTTHAANNTLQHSLRVSIRNTSSQQVTISAGDVRLISRIASSLSLSALPLEIPPTESRTIQINYTTPPNGGLNDTLMLYNSSRCPISLAIPQKGVVRVVEETAPEVRTGQTLLPMDIYPNPVNNECSLVLPVADQKLLVCIYSISGEKILELPASLMNRKFRFSTEDLVNGTYMLVVKTSNGTATGIFTVVR